MIGKFTLTNIVKKKETTTITRNKRNTSGSVWNLKTYIHETLARILIATLIILTRFILADNKLSNTLFIGRS